ncbi:MAG TPA: class I SAM-dependent methyltransferase [Terriglobia bacterium]|nr:class I SAM-dependent methyltransferase [Terriglobia bacterium]
MVKESVRQHFDREAAEFDGLIARLIPRYSEMIDALVSAVPFPPHRKLRVVDLGSGTGTVALQIKSRFPRARITCIDFSPKMLDLARRRLADCGSMRFIEADLTDYRFVDQYDVAVSSLALHHIQSVRQKLNLYRRLHDALARGGVFWNADAVLAASAPLQALYMAKWKEHMRRTVPEKEIEETWMVKHAAEDHPKKLLDELRWLREAGFAEPEVIWKEFYFAVFGGRKIL